MGLRFKEDIGDNLGGANQLGWVMTDLFLP